MGSKLGVLRVAAGRLGLSFEEYMAKLNAGLKWCNRCREWKPIDVFGIDRTRGDGHDARCHTCRRVKERKITKGRVSTFKGCKHTDETKRKLSEAHKGKPKMKLRGRKLTIEQRIKISQATRQRTPRGEACHSYKDGKSTERRGLRFTMEYKRWRFDVFARDRFTCQHCGDNRGGNLVAHHIKSFADYPELRFEVSNGIALCEICHDKLHYS